MEKAKSDLSIAKRNHTRLCNKINGILGGRPYENEVELNSNRLEICHTRLQDIYAEFLMISEKEDEGDLDKYMDNYENCMDSVFELFPNLRKGKKDDHKPAASIKLRIPDMKAFSNRIRDYPQFKFTFRNHYESSYGDHAALVLKQNLLTDYPQKLCQSAASVDDIFKSLDSLFGDEGKLVEAVMADIEKIPNCTMQSAGLKTLRDTIRLAQADLSGIKLAHLIEQYQTVMLIVRKLPEQIHRRWAEMIVRDSIPTCERFSKIMEFLDFEIRTLELMQPTIPVSVSCDSGPNSEQHQHGGGTKSGQQRQEYRSRHCPLHKDVENHDFGYCREFKRMQTEDKVKFLQSNDGKRFCRSCLRNDHQTNCSVKIPKCENDECERHHLTFMHDACLQLHETDRRPHSYRANSSPGDCAISSAAISPVQQIKVVTSDSSGFLNTLWDTGSNLTLITSSMCNDYGFERIEEDISTLTIETVGGNLFTKNTRRFKVPLYSHSRDFVCSVVAYEVDNIGTINPVNLEKAYDVFGLSREQRNSVTYPSGNIHLLLGCDNSHIVLHHLCEVDGLRLSESPLGKVVWGKHPSFTKGYSCRAVMARLNAPTSTKNRTPDRTMDENVRSLFSTESMGVSCIPQCGRCGCGKCSVDGDVMTPQERFEFEAIKSSLVVENGVITASFPYRKSLATLPDNYSLAMRRLCQMEKKLSKDADLAKQYQAQFDDMTARGKLRRLTPEEQLSWKGAIQYLPHNYVLKTNSASTPCRLIFDPSSPYKGHAVNDYWGRGPNLVNNAFGVLLRFCENPVAFFADISKMYQTIVLREREQHLHRVLWRSMETDRDPDVYIITCNSFGSGPAGAVAVVALQHIAEMKQGELPQAAKTIIEQSYVDDIMDSTLDLQAAERLSRQIDEILNVGGFKVKKWTFVDSSCPREASTCPDLRINGNDDAVLGQSYDTSSDEFYFRAKINFSKKRRGTRVGHDLDKDSVLDSTIVPFLTKRMILSQVHSSYDPEGYLAPFIVELKFAMGKLWRYRSETGQELDWDSPIPLDHDQHWRKLFSLFYDIGQVRIPRCWGSPSSTGQPILIMFSDSSMLAYGTCAYVRWECSDGSYFTKLITAKSRMWPIKPGDYISVCRGELQGAVLAARLAASIVKHTRFEFRETVYVVDSEIVLAQIGMDSHLLSVYVGPRVAEITTLTKDRGQWWFIPGSQNPCADLLSRGTTNFALLAKNSTWQKGPDWLHTRREEWPITQKRTTTIPIPELRMDDLKHRTMMSQDYSAQNSSLSTIDAFVSCAIQHLGEDPCTFEIRMARDIPPEIKLFTEKQRQFIAQLIDLKRHDDLAFWLAVTFRILHALSWRRGDDSVLRRLPYPPVVSATQRHAAKIFWIQDAQQSLDAQIRRGQLKTLTIFTDTEGIRRCNSRSGLNSGYRPILLPYAHPVSRLIVTQFHKRGHGGATATAARVRSEYHILQLRKLAQSVRKDCQLCKLVEKKLMRAPMGSLPISRLTPSFPFEHCSCDIFGPFHVQLIGKFTRNRKVDTAYTKAYGLIVTCLTTRAIHIELMHGQTTEAFLLAFRKFVCMRGQPKSMYSDCGGQLIAADDEMKSIVDSFNHRYLQQYGATNGMTWHYSAPGSPWQNGVSESLIKSVKSTLRTITNPDRKLPVSELQTILYEVGELLNERPINLGRQGASGSDYDADTNTYLCPNQLLLGRSTPIIPQGPFEPALPVDESSSSRLLAVQAIVTNWWERWTTLYFPTLIHQSKWFKDDRKPAIGDVVFVKDLNPIRGNWNLGEIVSVGDQDSPINVLVRYKNAKSERTVWRDVKNLSVIVPNELRVKPSLNLNPNAPSFVPQSLPVSK